MYVGKTEYAGNKRRNSNLWLSKSICRSTVLLCSAQYRLIRFSQNCDPFLCSAYLLSLFFFSKICHIKYVFKRLQNPRPRRLYCPDAVNHSFHATSCLSHNRPPCCHCNPLIGCGDCCPGADEGVVTEQERQRQRGRAGGSQRSPSSMRGQRQKCSISRAVSTKDFLR